MEQITIVTGPFGSGKSEISLALARKSIQLRPTALIDLDTVNPYFTSGQHRHVLESWGVVVEQPSFGGTGVDTPSLTGRIRGLLQQRELALIIDLGGDAVGARVLGSLNEFLVHSSDYDMLFVYNPYRPMVADPSDALNLLQGISARARLAMTGIINNANLAGLGAGDQLQFGQQQAEQLTALCDLPIVYHAGGEQALREFAEIEPNRLGEPLTLLLENRPSWL